MRYLFLALFLVPVLSKGQAIAEKTDELLTAYASQHKFSGNVLIGKGRKIIFEKSYGYADLKKHLPNNNSTEFRVGSLTKMFTSAVILQLVAENRLSLTDPVSRYVQSVPYGDSVTIYNLLSHTSGIAGFTGSPEPQDLDESVARFNFKPLSFQPGSRFEYNNFNYILLGFIAQKITGTPLARIIKTKVLDKANMQHSGLDTRERVSSNKAHGYVTNPATGEWMEADEGNVTIASGAGALYATACDLYNWSLALDQRAVLSDSMWQLAIKPVQNNYGLGWMTTNTFGRKQIGHTGSIPGFIANFMKFPDDTTTIILLSNYQDVDGRKLSEDLAAAAFGEKYELPVVKRAVTMNEAELKKYVGEYRLENGFTIHVSTVNNRLLALAQGDQEPIELTPEGNNKFFLEGPETAIEFIDENGSVKYMYVDMQGGQKFTKTK